LSVKDVIQILQQNVEAMQKAIKILGGAKAGKPRRTMSAAGRKRIAAAQRRRWAKVRAAKK
jgi:hypothetical protein